MTSTRTTILLYTLAAALSTGAVGACLPPSEAPLVDLPLVIDSAMTTPFTTDLGYEIELTRAQVTLGPIVFTTSGEVHTARPDTLRDMLVPSAWAHPGHTQDGEVIGELPGTFVIDWSKDDGRELGVASLIASEYDGANFTFAHEGKALQSAEQSVTHTAILSGVARQQGRDITFTITVNAPEGRALTGAPFEASISPDATGTIAFRLHTVDAIEGDTLLDGVDFAGLDADEDGAIDLTPESDDESYNTLRRALLSHDHYSFEYKP